jgi:TusA-related sulfurtransferase
MRTDERLDLSGVIKPYCLLQCKSVLASLKPGSILAIRIRDPETYHDLLTILERSGEIIVSNRKVKESFLIRVQKHATGCELQTGQGG